MKRCNEPAVQWSRLTCPLHLAALSALVWMLHATAHAATFSWNFTSTNWSTATAWTPNGAPSTNDTAFFRRGTTGGFTIVVGTNALTTADFYINSLLYSEGEDAATYLTTLGGRRLTVWGLLEAGHQAANPATIIFTNGTLEVGAGTNKGNWIVGITGSETGAGDRQWFMNVASSLVATNVGSLIVGKAEGTTGNRTSGSLDLSRANIVGGTFEANEVLVSTMHGAQGTLTFGTNASLTNLTIRNNFGIAAFIDMNGDNSDSAVTRSLGTVQIKSNVAIRIGSSGSYATNFAIATTVVTNLSVSNINPATPRGALVTTGGVFEVYARNLLVGQNLTNWAGSSALGTWTVHNATSGVIQADNVVIGGGGGPSAQGTVTIRTAAGSTLTNFIVNNNLTVGEGGSNSVGTLTLVTNMAFQIGSASTTATNLQVGFHSTTVGTGSNGLVTGSMTVSNGTVEGYVRLLVVGTNASASSVSSARGTLDWGSSSFVGGGFNVSNMIVGGGINGTGTVFFGSGSARATNLSLAAGSRIDLNGTTFGVNNFTIRTNNGTFTGNGLLVNLGTFSTAAGGGSIGVAVSNAAGSVIQATNAAVVLASNLFNVGTVNIGRNATNIIGGARFDNSGGTVRFVNTAADDVSALIVSNAFLSSVSSILSNNAGKAILRFAANNSVTNNGTMNLLMTTSSAGFPDVFAMSIGTSSNHYFVNNGTAIFAGGGPANDPVRFYVSNQFVNAGTMIISNGMTTATGDLFRPEVAFTGSARTSGGASTNTGTIRIASIAPVAGSSLTAPLAALFFSNGDFVNRGVITVNSLNSNDVVTPGVIVLSEANAIFSNAPDGRLVLESTASADQLFAIRAAVAVNHGSNIVNAGALLYQTSTGALNSFTNRGVVALNGGRLSANVIVNASGGTIETTSNTGSLVNATFNLSGGTVRASGGVLRALAGFGTQAGLVEITSGGTLIVGSTLAGNLFLTNTGTVAMNDGTLRSAGVVNLAGGTVRATGPATIASSLHNQAGGVVTANTANVTVEGTFTNAGTVAMINSFGRFNGAVVNSGTWSTDPTTNLFVSNFSVTSAGTVDADAGDVYNFRENFSNLSTQSNTWDTLNVTVGLTGAGATKFVFDDVAANGTQSWSHAGILLTGGFLGLPSPLSNGVQEVSSFAAVTGFQSNFALGRLEIGNAGTNSLVMVADSFTGDGNTAALFVNDLFIFGASQLIVSNDTRVYYVNANSWSSANVTLLGNAEIHQLQVIPEPSALLLITAAVGLAWLRRRV